MFKLITSTKLIIVYLLLVLFSGKSVNATSINSSLYVKSLEIKFLLSNSIIIILIITIIIIILFFKTNCNKQKKRIELEVNSYIRVKSYFMDNISHELKTPLTVILSSLELIKLQVDSKDEILNNNLNTIKKNCYRQLRLSNNIIDIIDIELGNSKLDLENIEIVSFIENIIIDLNKYMKNQKLQIIFDTTDEEIFLAIDVEKFRRILLNLISNAIKFSNFEYKILINIYKFENELKITLEDFGIGIENKNIEKIFGEFNQIDESMTRDNEGMGLGLSIVDKFIKLHNGKIFVKSSLGEGSIFEIFLPLYNIDNKDSLKFNKGAIIEIDSLEIELSDIFI